MINYKPKFGLGCTRPEQTELLSKFGGRPWGLDPACWPTRMALLCQLVHDPPMIDLGGDYVLHVWHWNSPDDYRDPPEYHFHCDYSTLVKRTDLGSGLTTAPKDQCLIGEVFIDGWEELEDNTPAEWLPEFFDESSYSDLQEREVGDIQFGCGLGTKIWRATKLARNKRYSQCTKKLRLFVSNRCVHSDTGKTTIKRNTKTAQLDRHNANKRS